MSVFTRLFPQWALSRAMATYRRQGIEALAARNFETQSNFRTSWKSLPSADSAIAPAAVDLRARSRHLAENHDLYVALVTDLVNTIVGAGVWLEPAAVSRQGAPLVGFNDQARKLWLQWTARPDLTGELPWSEIQRKVCWAWLADGEIFIRHHSPRSYPWEADDTQYRQELLEADYVPIEGRLPGNTTEQVQGIELDRFARPVRYNIYLKHPGDTTRAYLGLTQDTEAVDAQRITHLKFTRRWPQVRGQPIAHASFNRLTDLADYEESERIAAKMNASSGMIVTKDEQALGPKVGAVGADAQRIEEMFPGMIYHLLPGEDAKMMAAERPNPELTSFRASQLRAIVAGAGGKYSSVSRDYTGGSYSSQRQELVEGRVNAEALAAYFYPMYIRETYQRVIRQAALQGQITIPATASFDSLTRVDLQGPAIAWIDPLKETKADIEAINARLTTRTAIQKRRGIDPRTVADQLKAEALADADGAGAPGEDMSDDDARSLYSVPQ